MADVKLNISAFNKFVSKTVQPYLRKKAEEIADEARRTAPVGATSDLKNSITVTDGPNGSVKISVNADHAAYVTYGTGPQANPPKPAYYPKLRRRGLILWSESKNANPYAVAHGISQNGTPPNPYFEDSVARILNRFSFRWIRRDFER